MLPNETAAQRRIVILGANGYLGSSLCRFLHGLRGYSVTAVFRGRPGHQFFHDCLVADAFKSHWAEQLAMPAPFALINCAFEFAGIGEGELSAKYAILERNLTKLRALGTEKLINISTTSAYPGCRTDYGREKLFVEALFNKYEGLNVRPGMIASWRNPGAAMRRLIELTRSAKFVPLLLARDSGFYFCDLEAVVLGLFLLLGLRLNKPHTLSFCYRDRIKLGSIVRLIERRYGISRPKLPVPWAAPYMLLRIKEALFGKSKIRADSVLDFAYPARHAPGRELFARLVGDYRGELEALSAAERVPSGFYFLEGSSVQREAARSCRLKRTVGTEPLAALSRLADA